MPEKLHHDHLDQFKLAMNMFVDNRFRPSRPVQADELPGLWKADIKSAFRRIPIKPSHRWAAAIAFESQGKVRHSIIVYVQTVEANRII